METLKLNFDTTVKGCPTTYVVEVPYRDGIVATSEFCPTELLSGAVELMAAVRGESLDDFMTDCRMQLMAIAKIADAESELDLHIGGLMAVVMDHFSRQGRIVFGDLLIYVDCFSLLLKAAGYAEDEIRSIYPRVTHTIVELYPDYVYASADGMPFAGSRSKEILQQMVAAC